MGFLSSLKKVVSAPLKVVTGAVKGLSAIPQSLVSAGGQTIRSVAEAARTALPSLMQAAAAGAPVVGAALGGPLGGALGQLVPALLGGDRTAAVQQAGQQALAAAQHLAGGTPIPPATLGALLEGKLPAWPA